MTSLWPQIEPILAHVQKPARYIGCEDGAIVPGPLAGKVGWLLIYPDAYEIGLPNQGLQILYEMINERADARAERAYAPWTDMEARDAPAGAAPVLGGQPPPGRRVRSAGVQPVGRARLHQPPQLRRPGRRAGPSRRSRPRASAGGRGRPLHLQPRAAGRLRRLVRDRRR